MASPPHWQDNLFASRPLVKKRLEAIEGVYSVEGLKAFKQVSDPATRTVAPTDGTVYLIKDGYPPDKTNNDGCEQFVEIGYSIILAKYDPDTDDEEEELERLITRLARSMQGYDPKDENGVGYVIEPFTQANPLPITHNDGFAFYPLRFVAQVAILNLD